MTPEELESVGVTAEAAKVLKAAISAREAAAAPADAAPAPSPAKPVAKPRPKAAGRASGRPRPLDFSSFEFRGAARDPSASSQDEPVAVSHM